jgi:acetolactate synthase-1/2/3 large subunit
MSNTLSRRDLLRVTAAAGVAALPQQAEGGILPLPRNVPPGWVVGRMTGAAALTEALIAEGTECVFGIPGAQMNELWDTFKQRELPYLLVTHEFSAACMADGYARSKGKPGVLCIVPGPGLTNAISGIGEALLDSVPMVCVVGDIGRGDHFHHFQVHDLPQVGILRNVTKQVIVVQHESQIPGAIRQAFQLAMCGEPGPVGVVVPYNLLIETHHYNSAPLAPAGLPWDEAAANRALGLLSNNRLRVGIYAGMGCMDHSHALVQLAELLQAPVATSIAGKGVISETHPLSVGWGYGPQGTRTAEQTFRHVDLVLAIGVRFSEVSTGFYSLPQHRHLIHVDINPNNLGRIMRTEVCVNADAGVFLNHCLSHADAIRRPANPHLINHIHARKCADLREYQQTFAQCGVDPVALLLALRRLTEPDALTFVDVTCSQYWTTEVFRTVQPRTFFNPTNNQAMGWSIPAAIGAQRVNIGRQTLTITGDGCFLMSAMEVSTAARENLPVKFFILDDQAYHYMQLLQQPAYLRTTATILARLNYASLAQGWGVAYQEIRSTDQLEPCIRGALCHNGPVLVRVVTDYRRRPIRWIDAARARYTQELSAEQKVRFLARIGSRAIDLHPPRND